MKNETLKLITAELIKAREKFPSSSLSMMALTEEVGELAKAILGESNENVKSEAVQVAVMAIRVLEEGDPSTDEYRKESKLPPYPFKNDLCKEGIHDFRPFEFDGITNIACVNCGGKKDSVDICEHKYVVAIVGGDQWVCLSCGEEQPNPDEDDEELPFET